MTSMSGMFKNCKKLEEIDVNNFDTSSVTNMNNMFSTCEKVKKLDVINFDTSNVTNMSAMFNGLSGITKLDLSNFDTRNVDNIASMFSSTPLEELNLGRNFILKEGITTNGFEFKIPSTVKIITTRDIARRINQIKTSFTDANFTFLD